jgi:uncharacterized protein (TIGR01777 family)
MRIGITGASGLLGRELTTALRTAGHVVMRIGRGRDSDIVWNPAANQLDAAACAGIEAFINLAGASVGERWTAEHKRAIRESRVQATELIARTAAALSPRPRLLINASAVGIYGDAGDAVCDEETPAGRDFLADVGVVWERAADPARAAGIRTIHLRLGVVLSRHGGALPRMLPAFKLGAGGPLGGGRQWMSWVALEDVVGIVRFALDHDALSGPVNAVAPAPVTNADFTRALGRAVHRPALFPVPALALKLMFGEMAEGTLLVSQRVVPRRLLAAGYAFRFPDLDSALRAAVTA